MRWFVPPNRSQSNKCPQKSRKVETGNNRVRACHKNRKTKARSWSTKVLDVLF